MRRLQQLILNTLVPSSPHWPKPRLTTLVYQAMVHTNQNSTDTRDAKFSLHKATSLKIHMPHYVEDFPYATLCGRFDKWLHRWCKFQIDFAHWVTPWNSNSFFWEGSRVSCGKSSVSEYYNKFVYFPYERLSFHRGRRILYKLACLLQHRRLTHNHDSIMFFVYSEHKISLVFICYFLFET